MSIIIRPAAPHDIKGYTAMTQQTYEDAYTNDTIGLTKECFSEEVFNSDDTQAYLRSKLINTSSHHSWLALDDDRIIGSIAIEDKGARFELSSFYVLPEYQGKGIGTLLWRKILPVAVDKDITLDIYAHNTKTINLYKKWGFEEDTTRPHFYRHWPEWPESLQAECLYMRLHRRLAS